MCRCCASKARGNIRKADLELGEVIGELRETITMLTNPLSQLRKFLRSGNSRNLTAIKNLQRFLKTGTWIGATGKDAAKAATSTWLEVRYGLRPLLYLIGDLIEMAKAKEDWLFDPKKIRTARSHQDGISESKFSGVDLTNVGSFSFYGDLSIVDKYTAYASVQYRQTRPVEGLENFGLTPRFWPEVAWELTRLSFVVDWIVTIGPWLATLRYKPEVQVLGNTVGQKLERTVSFKATSFHTGYEWGTPDKSCDLGGKYTLTRYDREVDRDPLNFPLLKLGNTLGLFRAIDSVALILQNIKF